MSSILPVLLKVQAAALLFETANPRHQHDWEAFAALGRRLPDDKLLVPGVIDSTTNFIEHPRVVANRVMQFANIVGRERVIAGTDCGFSTFAGFGAVDPAIVWAKLGALGDGAAIASERLWARAA
jgi:5-methyltetrahydropteroyltriglutamate--homocysteine methyltransferase